VIDRPTGSDDQMTNAASGDSSSSSSFPGTSARHN